MALRLTRLEKVGAGTLTISGTTTTPAPPVRRGKLVANGNLTSSGGVFVDPVRRWPAPASAVDRGKRHAGARQLDRHADGQRQPRAGRQHLPGRSQRRRPERPINASGTATINGGTVQVVAQPGLMPGARPTRSSCDRRRQRHLRGVTSNFAFLTPARYDANNVFLTLLQSSALSPRARKRPTSMPSAPRSTGQRLRHRRLQHCAGCACVLSTRGAGGAQCHQRPALGRFRHDKRAGRHACS